MTTLLKRPGSVCFILAADCEYQLLAMLSRKTHDRQQMLCVHLAAVFAYLYVRGELLGTVDQYAGRPGVYAVLVGYGVYECFNMRSFVICSYIIVK